MRLLMKSAIEGAKQLLASFKILGPKPFKPAALDGSNLLINEQTCSVVIKGIWKLVSLGTLEFTNCFILSVLMCVMSELS